MAIFYFIKFMRPKLTAVKGLPSFKIKQKGEIGKPSIKFLFKKKTVIYCKYF